MSLSAMDLIRRLITDSDDRLGRSGTQEIKNHPFFKGIDWDNIRKSKAPNIPNIKNNTDISNFDKFEEEEPWIQP